MSILKQNWIEIIKKVLDPDFVSDVEPVTIGGSDRNFYRLFGDDKSFILIESSNLAEMKDYLEIGSFFYRMKIAVPKILAFSRKKDIAILEDAGNSSLQEIIKSSSTKDINSKIIKLYKTAIKELIKIQKITIKIPFHDLPEAISSREFDFDYYRWETNYFLEKCSRDYLGFDATKNSKLIKELEALARSLREDVPIIVHRDFQSQNIYVRDRKILILDFQASRLGSLFYDVASLLKDPYVELPADVHNQLFKYYMENQREANIWSDLSDDHAWDIYQRVSLQRLMQALGAYGNLGHNKGKKIFLQYISPALRLLKNTLLKMDGNFYELKRLVKKLEEINNLKQVEMS